MIRAGASHPDRLAALEAALALFARRLPKALSELCGGEVRAKLAGIEHVPLSGPGVGGEFAASARFGGGVLRLRAAPAALQALIALWSRDEGEARPEGPLTAIERRMALGICDWAWDALAGCVDPTGEARAAPGRLGVPDDDPPDALGARARLELTIAGVEHAVTVLVPHDGVAAGAPPPEPAEEATAAPGLVRRIGAARVTLSAVLGGGQVRLGDTFDWRPGTVVDLGVDRAQRIDLRWDGRTMFDAVAGRRRNGRMALRVVEDLRTKGDAR